MPTGSSWRLISGVASTFFLDNFRPEVVSDIISGAVIDLTGVKILVKLVDSRSNGSRYV